MGEKLHLGILALFDILMQNDFLLQFEIMKERIANCNYEGKNTFCSIPSVLCHEVRQEKKTIILLLAVCSACMTYRGKSLPISS